MTNVIFLTEAMFEAAIEHAERGEWDMMGLKLGSGWKVLAKKSGQLDAAHVDALYGRLVEALETKRGAA